MRALKSAIVIAFACMTVSSCYTSLYTTKGQQSVLTNRANATVMEMIEGAIAGLNINYTDGKPGASPEVNIRGTGSINPTSILILIDGVEGDPNMLNPNDVESISVVKDGSSVIYGSRAANGVVLITTKSGRSK